MTEIDLKVIVEALQSPWQEYAYWWSQIALTAIAAVTGWAAWGQLKSIRQSRDETAHIARATFLLELDRRWDSERLIKARLLLTQMRERASKEVATEYPTQNDGIRAAQISKKMSDHLTKLHTEGSEDYQTIMSICGFFETAGLMVKNNHITKVEIDALFRGPIEAVNLCFRPHIVHRQNEIGVPGGLYEHALYLCDELSK